MLTRRALVGLAALMTLPRCSSQTRLLHDLHDASSVVTVEDHKTLVLDGWTVIMTRAERLRDIIKGSYLHRDLDRDLLKRARQHLDEIEEYLDRIENNIKW